MNGRYILNTQGEPVSEPDLMTWARWIEVNFTKRSVVREQVGHSVVSTVFLGLDHAFGGGPPILWETMVFHGKLTGEMDRCSGSREQAEAMHQRMVERVKKGDK